MKVRFIIILLFTYFTISGQNSKTQQLDSLFNHLISFDQGMGSVSIFDQGQEVYSRSIGYADIGSSQQANKSTKYRIGSITKTFIATIVMQMVEEDKLSLDTKLDQYFSKVKNAKKITIEHLLRHQSGIANLTAQSDYIKWMEESISRELLMEKINLLDSDFKPGKKMSYSNSGYILLTFIVEKIDKKGYEAILQDRIFTPCELSNTSVGAKINSSNNEALSYSKLDEWSDETETDMSIPLGAGSIISTPTDINQFFHCLFNHQLVSENSLKQMISLDKNVGMGLFQIPFYSRKSFGHTGGIDGFRSMAAYFPNDNVAVCYLSNGVNYPLNDIMIGILSQYYGKSYDFPEFKKADEKIEKDLSQYIGEYKSKDLPINISVRLENGELIAQGSGQGAFALEAIQRHVFKYDAAKLKMEFIPVEDKMILHQGGGKFVYKRK